MDTKVPQPSDPCVTGADEVIYKEKGDRFLRVATTAASLDAERDSDKPKESKGFDEIIDFLHASTIKYSLMIQALVDKKRIIITETSIRRSLRFKDESGIDCLPTKAIFEQLALMGRRQRNTTQDSQPSGSAKDIVPTQSSNSPLSRVNALASREDELQLIELMDLCTKLSDREDASKQRRNDQEEEMMFDMAADMEGEEIVVNKDVEFVQKVVDKVVEDVTAAGIEESDTTAAHIKTTGKPKARSKVMHELSKETKITIPKNPASKDKGKAKMVKHKKLMKKKTQIQADVKLAQTLADEEQEKFEEEQRIAIERVKEQRDLIE
nr:hypothetical protein [Tanacetum cinerariifolium]